MYVIYRSMWAATFRPQDSATVLGYTTDLFDAVLLVRSLHASGYPQAFWERVYS